MGNIISYLKWRGDLDFEEYPFCEADNLVLSALIYLDFSGIVPKDKDGIKVRDAAKEYFKVKTEGKRKNTVYEQVLMEMADSRRFSDAVFSCYEEKTDETAQTQFAAMEIALGDGTYYLAFRGTDDSIVGWREDFSISYKVVPAQMASVDYLHRTMSADGCVYRIGGHSKGGNLAIYAAMKSSESLQKKIICVYNNDGPGICDEMVDREGYERIRERIVRLIPEFCVIGMLFEPDVTPVIIKSNGKGLLQHDIMTWQIEGDQLCAIQEQAEESRFYNDIFKRWIESADWEQRETFTRDFFDALEAGGATTIPQIAEGGLDGFGTILLSIAQSESRTKIVIGKFIRSFLERARQVDVKEFVKSKDGIRGTFLILAGLVFFVAPEFALQSIGIVITALVFFWSAKKLLDCAMKEDEDRIQKKRQLIVYMAFLSVMVFLATHHNILLVSGSILIGILFFTATLYVFRKLRTERENGIKKYIMAVAAILLFFTGCVSVTTPDRAFIQKMFAIGSFLILCGFGILLTRIYKSSEKSA